MKLPELSAKSEPDFVDAASAKKWLEHVPLANVATAQQQIREQVAEFNRLPAAAANRLAVMETLREAVNFVQLEQGKRFTNRALPMLEAEAAAFRDTTALWGEMHLGYMRCLEAAVNGDAKVRAQAALICQRLLAYTGLKMFHYYRAYRQVPPAEWSALHSVYAAAEKLGVVEEGIKDFLNRDVHDTSPRIAYARALLMGICNANELGPRQLTFVAFLLERWAGKLEVKREPVLEPDLPPLVVDLTSDHAPERLDPAEAAKAAEPRYLDTRQVAKSLRNRVGLLRKGESPAKLALGEDCVQPSCEQLLVFLYRQWCQAKPPRGVERRPVADKAEVTNELAAIHFYISGRVFRQPTEVGEEKPLTAKQQQELETLGRVSSRGEEEKSDAPGFVLEQWRLDNESAQGLRLVRSSAAGGRRYGHGQLVAVRPSDARQFMLGHVRWLMAAENGELHAGIKVLPGLPSAVAVRATGLNVPSANYVPALALTAVPALNSPPSLVLPSGWFKPKRMLEVFGNAVTRAQLNDVIERGADFERVSYELLP